MRVRRWLNRIASVSALLLVLIVLATAIAVRSDWARGEVRHLIERQAASFLDGTLTVGRVTGSLLGGVTLEHVALQRQGETVFAASRIDVQYNLWSLWRGGREIRAIRLVDMVVRLDEAHGHWSASDWVKPRPKGGGPSSPFVLSAIEIVNGRLLANARESTWRLPPELTQINGEIQLRIGGPTEITLTRLSFATPDGTFRARSATGVITLPSNETRLTNLRIDADGVLTVNGSIGASAVARPVHLDAQLETFVTRSWRPFTPLLETIDLTASGPLAVGGTFDRTTIQTTLRTSAGTLTTGNTLIVAEPNRLTISGASDVQSFDAESVTNDPQWASAVTGHVTFTAVGTGSPAAWTADVSLAGGPVRALDVVADAVQGNVKYANQRLTFDALTTAYGVEGHATGTVLTSPALVVDVIGDHLINIDPRRLPASWNMPNLDALAAVDTFSAHWTAERWNATVHLNDSTLEGGSIQSGTVVELTSAPDQVTLMAEGDVRNVDARRLGHALDMSGLDDPLFETQLNGHVRVTGHGRAWSAIDLAGRGTLLDSEAGEARISSAEVTFSRDGHHNTARIIGAIVGLDPQKVGAPAAAASDINGNADLIVEWQDDAADVAAGTTARGTLRLTPSTIVREDVDRGVITGEWRDGIFNAQTIDLEGRGLHVTGRGRIALTAGASSATFEVAAADVHVLEPWTGRVLHGPATATGELRGTFEAPEIVASIESGELSDADLGTFANVAASVDFTLPDWDSLRTNGPVTVRASTWTNTSGTLVREVLLDGRLDSWTAFRGRAAGRLDAYLLQGQFTADWADELTANVSAAEIARGQDQWRLDPSAGRLQVSSSRLTATNLRLTNGMQSIGVDGTLLLDEGALTPSDRLTVTATDLDLAAIDRFLGLQAEIVGRASATVSLVGRVSDPRGRITLDGKNLTVRGYTIASITGSVDLANGAADADVVMTQPDGVALRAAGRIPLSAVLPDGSLAASVPRPEWDLSLVTEPLELKIFGPVLPRVEGIAGQMIADVRVVGAADRPRVTGTVALADAAFRIPSAGIAFSRVTADIGLQPDLVTVRKFVASDKHGHPLKITGQLAVAERQVGAFNVNVEGDRVSLVDNAIGSIELSMLLQLSGDVDHPKLTGNVEVANGRVEIDRLLRVLSGDPFALVSDADLPPEGETPVDLRAEAERAAADAASRSPAAFDSKSFFSGLEADVRILAPDNLILRGSRIRPSGKDGWSLGDLNVTVGGELSATRKPGADPIVLGDVTTIRGVYSFEGKRFEIQRGGHIRFTGDVPIDPTFDVRGIRRIQGVEARVDVRGRLSDPSLVLGSNLPLDEADILSMIVFNRPVNQLGEAQRADLVGAAANLAGGYVTSPLTSRLSKALDLDLLEVETVTFGQNVAPRIRVGQQIGNRLFVQFAQQFGPQSLSELTAEYQLARFLRLQANTAQGPGSRAQRSLLQRTERFGLDLIFFFNY
jgi:autotransporter translocation and assembly factor TamB